MTIWLKIFLNWWEVWSHKQNTTQHTPNTDKDKENHSHTAAKTQNISEMRKKTATKIYSSTYTFWCCLSLAGAEVHIRWVGLTCCYPEHSVWPGLREAVFAGCTGPVTSLQATPLFSEPCRLPQSSQLDNILTYCLYFSYSIYNTYHLLFYLLNLLSNNCNLFLTNYYYFFYLKDK